MGWKRPLRSSRPTVGPFFCFLEWSGRHACERERQVPWSFVEARCAPSDAEVPLEGRTRQAAREVALGVPSVTCCAGWGRREGLGEAARGRSWLELPFQSFLRAVGLLGRAGKLVVRCTHG